MRKRLGLLLIAKPEDRKLKFPLIQGDHK
jgi:hypothetical protein